MLTPSERWEQGIPHTDRTKEVYDYLSRYTDFSFGGDGDEGEDILYVLDMYFEAQEEKR